MLHTDSVPVCSTWNTQGLFRFARRFPTLTRLRRKGGETQPRNPYSRKALRLGSALEPFIFLKMTFGWVQGARNRSRQALCSPFSCTRRRRQLQEKEQRGRGGTHRRRGRAEGGAKEEQGTDASSGARPARSLRAGRGPPGRSGPVLRAVPRGTIFRQERPRHPPGPFCRFLIRFFRSTSCT